MPQEMSYKGKWCPYEPSRFCQEGWCDECNIYRTWESSLYSEKPVIEVSTQQCKKQCPDGLIELRNFLAGELEDERKASSQYGEASTKFTHFKYPEFSQKLQEMSKEEMQHFITLKAVIKVIDEDCGCQ